MSRNLGFLPPHINQAAYPRIEHCFAAYEVLLMAILRAAVNLDDEEESTEKEGERKGLCKGSRG